MTHGNLYRGTAMAKKSENRKPERVLRFGALSCSIWRNEHKDRDWFSVTFQRAYKDKDDEWAYSESLNMDDVLVMALLLERTYVAIREIMWTDSHDDDEKEREPEKEPEKEPTKEDKKAKRSNEGKPPF